MTNSSPMVLKILAAILWFCGVIILYSKSYTLLLDAQKLNPDRLWILLSLVSGLLIGILKSIYLFKPVCIKNLKRIYALKQPKIWNFYRPQFYIFMFIMINLGMYLSRVAQGDYLFLLAVAILDLSIATALLLSSRCFWNYKKS